ncbi:MAG: Na+/H+ antiporter NhaC family protein [Acetivibrio ethanolgignens]
MHFGWLSIIPPIIAIVLALATKEVISSLLIGILAGALIFTHGSPMSMIETTFAVMGERMADNVNILIFLGLLGALVVIVTKGGGSAAYGNWAVKKIKTRRGASLATGILGCIIFIDDYFNCLTVGTVMKPVTDKHRISRAKLAYLLDATAAPICIIAPVSSWGASVAGYIEEANIGNGMGTFIKAVPFNMYALLTIIMVVIVCTTKLQFGSMAKFEKNAIEKGDLFSNEAAAKEETIDAYNKNGKVMDLIIPILSLIVFSILAMIYTGGGFSGETVLYVPRKILSFKEFFNCIGEGVKSMVGADIILILAWTIGGICNSEHLGTGLYVGEIVSSGKFPVFILPMLIFVVAGFLGFATGTSWGTMALLIPIAGTICTSPQTSHLALPILGAILGGAVYGDHISPISDTTILSSTGAGCNHLDHVSTQLVYATVVASCSAVGYLLMGLIGGFALPFAVALGLMLLALFIANKKGYEKMPIDYSNVNH